MQKDSAAIPLASFTTFGALLRYLRRRAQLTQRDLGIAVGYSEGHITRLEKNQRLPDLTALMALFVPALLPDQEPETVGRLLALAAVARGERLPEQPPVTAAPVQSVAPHPHPQQAPPHNIPAPLTPLFGRTAEVQNVCQHLLHPDVRLLTLTGPPGVGKTRLSLGVAAALLEQFAQGVYFVSLAPLTDPSMVAGAIAHILDIKEGGGQSLWAQLQSVLREQQVLLILDNFEHLLTAAPLLTALLTAAPRLKILVTSRIVLHLSGEQEWRVAPLALPALAQLPGLDTLAQNPAIALFVARAQAVNPHFVLDAANALSVTAICVRLDGLPLALELAAARTKLLDPPALLNRLHQRLPLLRGGARDLPARQQTLQEALAWSYDLLPADAQLLFARLGVFVGGGSLAAVEVVCGTPEDANATAMALNVLDALQSLLDASLVQLDRQMDEPRLHLLETIREYALAQLAASGEGAALQQRHATFYLHLAEQAEPELTGAEQARWLMRLEAEHDNLRAALSWVRDQGEEELGLRLAGALWRFWYVHGHLREGRAWLGALLGLATSTDPAMTTWRAKALFGAGGLAWAQGDYPAALALAEQSLTLYRSLDDATGSAVVLNLLGVMARDQGDAPQATNYFEECLVLQRATGNQLGIANALNNLGTVARDQGLYAHAMTLYEECLTVRDAMGDVTGSATTLNNLGELLITQGDYARATTLYNESAERCRLLGNRRGVALALSNLANLRRYHGDYAQATALAEESLMIRRQLGEEEGIAISLLNLGEIAYAQDDYTRAVQLADESLTHARAIGHREWIALALHVLGQVAHRQGESARAVAYFTESLQLYQASGLQYGLLHSLEAWADLAASQQQAGRAILLLSVTAAHRARTGTPRTPPERLFCEQTLATARAQLGEADFNTAWAAGQAMTLAQAVREVVGQG